MTKGEGGGGVESVLQAGRRYWRNQALATAVSNVGRPVALSDSVTNAGRPVALTNSVSNYRQSVFLTQPQKLALAEVVDLRDRRLSGGSHCRALYSCRQYEPPGLTFRLSFEIGIGTVV